MDFKEDILKQRKEYLGLDKVLTKLIFEQIIDYYKNLVVKAPREVIGYTIDIVICNMNFYNKLGSLENLNKTWGDTNLYVDLNNSEFVSQTSNDDEYEEIIEELSFRDISEFKEFKNISFSLKEMIELCRQYDFSLKILAKDDKDHETTLEISPYLPFAMNDNIKCYLETLK